MRIKFTQWMTKALLARTPPGDESPIYEESGEYRCRADGMRIEFDEEGHGTLTFTWKNNDAWTVELEGMEPGNQVHIVGPGIVATTGIIVEAER